MIENGKRYLVTTDNWFEGPDGEQYRAAWGTCYLKTTEQVFGFTPVRPSTNWFIEVGYEEKGIIIAGCQIHFVICCENRPQNKNIEKTYIDKDTGFERSVNRIYIAE